MLGGRFNAGNHLGAAAVSVLRCERDRHKQSGKAQEHEKNTQALQYAIFHTDNLWQCYHGNITLLSNVFDRAEEYHVAAVVAGDIGNALTVELLLMETERTVQRLTLCIKAGQIIALGEEITVVDS